MLRQLLDVVRLLVDVLRLRTAGAAVLERSDVLAVDLLDCAVVVQAGQDRQAEQEDQEGQGGDAAGHRVLQVLLGVRVDLLGRVLLDLLELLLGQADQQVRGVREEKDQGSHQDGGEVEVVGVTNGVEVILHDDGPLSECGAWKSQVSLFKATEWPRISLLVGVVRDREAGRDGALIIT